jgi:hypothetical protein
MKLSDVPKEAYNREPTPIPTKLVADWPALYEILKAQRYIIMECPPELLRNGRDAPNVKAFNCWMREASPEKCCLRTRRITTARWFISL